MTTAPFEFITIPEEPLEAGPHSVRYRDLRSHYESKESLARWVPDRLLDKATHFDPEFGTNTYGDNCERAPRAFGLKEVRPGDLIFFLVRLARWSEGRFTGESGFCLIGFIEVESVFRASAHPAGATPPARYAANAHVRRAIERQPVLGRVLGVRRFGPFDTIPPRRASRPRLRRPRTAHRDWPAVRLVVRTDPNYRLLGRTPALAGGLSIRWTRRPLAGPPPSSRPWSTLTPARWKACYELRNLVLDWVKWPFLVIQSIQRGPTRIMEHFDLPGTGGSHLGLQLASCTTSLSSIITNEERETMPMKNPPHPGRSVRGNCLDPLGLSVTEAAEVLGVARHTLSRVLNGHAAISPDMAISPGEGRMVQR